MREGEHGPAARLEFQHNDHIYAILEATEPEEQKKYWFHYFGSILIARRYYPELEEFLQEGARKAGFELKLVKGKKKKPKKPAPVAARKPEPVKKPTPSPEKLTQKPKEPTRKPAPPEKPEAEKKAKKLSKK